jgi:hypothetical protein
MGKEEMKTAGFIVLRGITHQVEKKDINGTKWKTEKIDFMLEFMKKRLYERRSCAEEAVKHLQERSPEDKFEIHEVFWHGIKF